MTSIDRTIPEQAAPTMSNPLRLAIILFVVVATVFGFIQTSMATPLYLILIAEGLTLLLMFHRPVWAIVSLAIGQFTASNQMLLIAGEEVSIRFLWTVLVWIFALPILSQRWSNLSAKAKWVFVPAFVFFAWTLIANLAGTDLDYTIKYFRQTFTAFTILLMIPILVSNKKDVKLLLVSILVIGSISSFIAIMQHYYFQGFPVITLAEGLFSEGRSVGLTHSPVHLAYGLPILLMGILAFYTTGNLSQRKKMLFVALGLLIGMALFFTYTRSGALAVGVGALVIALFLKGKLRIAVLIALFVVGSAFFLYSDSTNNRYAPGVESEGSASARAVLWPAAVEMATDNPLLGLGHDKFTDEATTYYAAVSEEYSESFVIYTLSTYQPHNDFLMVWVSFGTPALLAFIAFFAGMFLLLRRSYTRASDPLLKAAALCMIGAIPAYISNAATHNIMDSLYILWIIGGISIALSRLTLKDESIDKRGLIS